MKGILLAGGRGRRLWALTGGANKHLLEVGGEPMLLHGLRKLAGAGVAEIAVVTGSGDAAAVQAALAAAAVSAKLVVQPRPLGIAEGLGRCAGWAAGAGCAVLLADNLFEEALAPLIEAWRPRRGARIHLKEVADPSRFGVAVLEGGAVTRIVEKPEEPLSPWAIAGVYLFDEQLWEFLPELRPSARGEIEISDVLQLYLERGALSHRFLTGWWLDAGTPESLITARALAAGRPPRFT